MIYVISDLHGISLVVFQELLARDEFRKERERFLNDMESQHANRKDEALSAKIYQAQGLLHEYLDRLEKAKKHFRKTIKMIDQLASNHKGFRKFQTEVYDAYAAFLLRSGCAKEFSIILERELEIIEQTRELSDNNGSFKDVFSRFKIDIHSEKRGIAGRLSNFTRRGFVFDGIACHSIEGVLQSFKFKNPNEQRIICGLWGIQAKLAGENQDWKVDQILYWNGQVYDRSGVKYKELIERLILAVYEQDEQFRKDLARSKRVKMIHSIGKQECRETVLTEKEFLDTLKMLAYRKEIHECLDVKRKC